MSGLALIPGQVAPLFRRDLAAGGVARWDEKIYENRSKDDRVDASYLARFAPLFRRDLAAVRGARSLPSQAREEPRAAGGVARGRDKAGGTPANVPSERSRRATRGA